jgi:hypothetical protein
MLKRNEDTPCSIGLPRTLGRKLASGNTHSDGSAICWPTEQTESTQSGIRCKMKQTQNAALRRGRGGKGNSSNARAMLVAIIERIPAGKFSRSSVDQRAQWLLTKI